LLLKNVCRLFDLNKNGKNYFSAYYPKLTENFQQYEKRAMKAGK